MVQASATHTAPVPPDKVFLRLPQILTLIPVGSSSWWRWCAQGKAPKPIKLGAKTTVWKADEIYAFIEQMRKEGAANET